MSGTGSLQALGQALAGSSVGWLALTFSAYLGALAVYRRCGAHPLRMPHATERCATGCRATASTSRATATSCGCR